MLRALVLEEQGERYRIFLPETTLRLPWRSRRRLKVGEELWLEVEGSEPRAGRLRAREVPAPAAGPASPGPSADPAGQTPPEPAAA